MLVKWLSFIYLYYTHVANKIDIAAEEKTYAL